MSRVRAAISMATVVAMVLVGAAAAHAAAGRLLPSRPVLYVIGDSWSAGLYADPAHALAQDAAADLGMSAVVDAESGTGYVTAAFGTRTYEQRAADVSLTDQADLVVLQGGSNDVGTPAPALRAAVARTVSAVRTALPRSRVVLLGPGPDPWPVTGQQEAVDGVLSLVARSMHLTYVSPMRERWFTASNVATIIDPRTAHPTVRGDQVIGRLLAADLRTARATPRAGARAAARGR